MAIIGSISLHSATLLSTTPLSYQVWINVNAVSDSELIRMSTYYDSALVNNTTIPTAPVPKYSYGTTAVPYLLGVSSTSTGWHNVEVEFENNGGDVERYITNFYLDLQTPTINNFSKIDIRKNGAGDFVVSWDVDLHDDAGISKIKLGRVQDPSYDKVVTIPIGIQDYHDTIQIVVPQTIPNNSTHDFYIEVTDYSDNQITSATVPVFFTTTPPVITNYRLNYISQTATDYILDMNIDCVFATTQKIVGYSSTFATPVASWNSYLATGGTVSINTQVVIDKATNNAGTYKTYAQVKDDFGNLSPIKEYEFTLDTFAPTGDLKMSYAEKVGTHPSQFYYANLHFTATDSGKVTHYAFSDVGPSHLTTWNPIVPPSTVVNFRKTYNLGQSGSKTVYTKYRDFSGNESDVYAEAMTIDNSPPAVSLGFVEGEKRADGDYDALFDITAIDSDAIKFIKLYAVNSNTGNLVSGHTNNWIQITDTTHLIERRPIVIPAAEHEDLLDFHFQARDIYGNESTKPVVTVQFDKQKPSINNFVFTDTTKGATEYRIHTKFNAIDNHGIVAYRYHFDNVTLAPWIFTTKTTHLEKDIYLDVPNPSDLGAAKNFLVQVKDAFGNESNANSLFVKTNDIPPEKTPGTDGLKFAGGALTPTDYVLSFQVDVKDTDPTDNVYFYSLEVDNASTINWKQFSTPNNTISEILTMNLPRTTTGKHDFYLRVADKYKNISPVYNLEYDLDAIQTVGGLTLNNVTKSITTYTANVELFAVDNRKIQSYFIQDSESGPEVEVAIVPPVQVFNEFYEFPIGLTAGPKWATVRYKDNFDNMSDTYRIDFDLDTTDPYFEYYFAGSTSNATHVFLDFDLDFRDNYQLQYYKFWDSTVLEPSDWTEIPRANNVSVSKTITLPKGVLNPTFTWKVQDFFGNANTGSFSKYITTTPPISTLSLNSISYSVGDINVGVDYDIQAAAGSMVDKYEVDINAGSHTYTVDLFPNETNPKGTFYHSYPITEVQSDIKIHAISDYGYRESAPMTLTTLFDSTVPVVSNATFLGSYGIDGDYVLQFRVTATDTGSGIRTIIFHDPAGHISDVVSSTPLTHSLDQNINVRVDGSYPLNTISPIIYVEDLLRNRSTGNTVPSIYLDNAGAAVNNVIINSNTRYPSVIHTTPGVGANTNIIPVEFEAHDYSEITHYLYSPLVSVPFNPATWKAVPTPALDIAISETIDLDALGFTEGHGAFFIHTKDRFDNISVAGEVFEYDKTKPTVSIAFQNRIERANVAGVDHFVVPYTMTYNDNHAEVIHKVETTRIGGVWSSANVSTIVPEALSAVTNEAYYIPVGNYGDTRINVSVIDRLNNQSSNTDFDVWLEDNPPVINYGIINSGAAYTTNKNVLVRIDMLDDRGVTDYLISNTANLVWNSPGWATIPLSPATAITSTFSVDLEALGFDQGTCNVHMYIKDFCQNVSNTVATIIYDYEPPEVVDFKIDGFVRTPSTFDITLNAHAYDITSGLVEYYISQSNTETVYNPVPGTPPPIINDGSAPTEFKKVEQVSVRDAGWKWFYFSAIDAAGNVSEKANTRMYIDSIAPVGVTFESASPIDKYYLSNTQTNFNYTVTDDYALSVLGYNFDGGGSTLFRSYPAPVGFALGTTADSGTFSATTMTTLDEGFHTIFLVVKDTFNNSVEVPYEFYLDNTAPEITRFEISEIRPWVDPPPSTNFWVEFNLEINDNAGIDRYELYDNGVLMATVPVKDTHVAQTPKLHTTLSTLTPPTGLDIQFVLLEDIFGVRTTDVFALVNNYTGSPAEDAAILNVASAKGKVLVSELSLSARPETDIRDFHKGMLPAPQTLADAIPTFDDTNLMPVGYKLFSLEQRTNPVSDSRMVDFMKNEPGHFVYTDANTAESSVNQYTKVAYTPIYTNASVDRELHVYEIYAYDYAGNMSSNTYIEAFHDGTSLAISNMEVDGAASISRTGITNEVFEADIDSLVEVEKYALTIQPTIDFYNAFWEDLSTPAKSVAFSETRSTNEFALSNVGPDNIVYLHAKDRNGHITTSSVQLSLVVKNPTITTIASPINLKREGGYYTGTLVFDIESKP